MTRVTFQEWSNGELYTIDEGLRRLDARNGATKRLPEIMSHLDGFVHRHGFCPDAFRVVVNGKTVQSGRIGSWPSGDGIAYALADLPCQIRRYSPPLLLT